MRLGAYCTARASQASVLHILQMRQGRKPDGICLVVGTCSRGFDPSQNKTGKRPRNPGLSVISLSCRLLSNADLLKLQHTSKT